MNFDKKRNTIIVVISIYALTLLVARMTITNSSRYLFLVWNLFLALIPLLISMGLGVKKWPKIPFWIGLGIWLLFLPNAPYIITDFIHLSLNGTGPIWLDLLLISSFAIVGLMSYLFSLNDVFQIINNRYSKKHAQIMVIAVSFLSGLGIFLGRFLRWNSWDIIQKPQSLLFDIYELFAHPKVNLEAWLIIWNFSLFFLLMYWVYGVSRLRTI